VRREAQRCDEGAGVFVHGPAGCCDKIHSRP
jgi:hypothetical protein